MSHINEILFRTAGTSAIFNFYLLLVLTPVKCKCKFLYLITGACESVFNFRYNFDNGD